MINALHPRDSPAPAAAPTPLQDLYLRHRPGDGGDGVRRCDSQVSKYRRKNQPIRTPRRVCHSREGGGATPLLSAAP